MDVCGGIATVASGCTVRGRLIAAVASYGAGVGALLVSTVASVAVAGRGLLMATVFSAARVRSGTLSINTVLSLAEVTAPPGTSRRNNVFATGWDSGLR